MKKLSAVVLAFAALPARAAGVVECTGANDGPAVQAALDGGGITTLHGVCEAPGQRIRIRNGLGNQSGETVLQGGVIRAAGIDVDGARRVTIRGTEIYATGYAAIHVKSAIQVEIHGAYTHTYNGDGVVLESIAGVWIGGKSQITGGTTGVGLKIGDSSAGFEAVDVNGTLFEGFDTAVRIGAYGNCVNIWLRGIKIDRPASVGIFIAPHGAGNVRNVMISDFWINGGIYAIGLSTLDTSGGLARVEINGGHILGSQHGIQTWGVNIDHRVTSVVYGPLEPG